MAKKKQPGRRTLSPMKGTSTQKKGGSGIDFDLYPWLKTALVELPRYVRLLLIVLMSLGVTLATFPLLTWMFRGIAVITNNPDLALSYTFTTDRTQLNVLLAFSSVVGAVYYFIGWRIYIGIVGETPHAHGRVVWYFIVGVFALLLGAAWIIAGILSGSAPAV